MLTERTHYSHQQAHARPLKHSSSGAALSALARAFSRTPRSGEDATDLATPPKAALPTQPSTDAPSRQHSLMRSPSNGQRASAADAAPPVQVSYFVMGTRQHGWRHTSRWPPAAEGARRLFLAAPNALQEQAPVQCESVQHAVLPGQCPKVGVPLRC